MMTLKWTSKQYIKSVTWLFCDYKGQEECNGQKGALKELRVIELDILRKITSRSTECIFLLSYNKFVLCYMYDHDSKSDFDMAS